MLAVTVAISEIYIPAEPKKLRDEARIEKLAEEIMSDAEQTPIQIRKGKDRYVLVKGINRLEARIALGEDTIDAFIVAARRF